MVFNRLTIVGTDTLIQFIRPIAPIQSNGAYHYVKREPVNWLDDTPLTTSGDRTVGPSGPKLISFRTERDPSKEMDSQLDETHGMEKFRWSRQRKSSTKRLGLIMVQHPGRDVRNRTDVTE